MAVMNLHDKPFDEGTITKLEIFETYTKEWLPTFIMTKCPEIWIFDFFAGTGYDTSGVPGSPIRILQQVKNQIGHIFNNKTKVKICFNEYDKNKFEQLKEACEQYCKDNPELERANIQRIYRQTDFADLFPKTLSCIKQYPSLVFLDQNGIKFLSEKYFLELANTSTTDFLYYLSSSYFLRFGNTPEFQTNLKIDIQRASQNPYKYIHKSILEQVREKIPVSTNVSLYPFTIKKNSNVYGIIFGASHPRAVDKFLKTAWEKNNINGEANFDIDSDRSKIQLDLFAGKMLTKIETFSKALRESILCGNIKNNKEAYDYTLKQGHISTHASDEIKKMKKEGLVNYEGKSPLVNYEQVYKNERILYYEIKKI